MFKWLLSLLIFTASGLKAQERFLELEIQPLAENNETVRDFQVIVTTTENISFEIGTKRKKTSFYLPPGENYKLEIVKEGFFKTYFEIDLREVPYAIGKKSSEYLKLKPKLLPSSGSKQGDIVKFRFDPRYGKIMPVTE
ncbi:MAG: hypothetical protein R3277_01620 [Brumimicrobium sp.]|nr:hypothetical protein [Brumimicrobium sp.]